jgi:hydroxymethylpyrimidine/phosphomethylpyrimidine kinase
MKITQISFSKTVESQVMGAGIWTKISVTGEVGENENVANAIEEAKTEVETALQKYLPQPQTGDLYFNVTKNKEEIG